MAGPTRSRSPGLGVDGIGASTVDAEGEVYNLTNLAEFPGAYGLGQYGAVAGKKSVGDMWLENPHHVVLHLKAKREGLMLSVGAERDRCQDGTVTGGPPEPAALRWPHKGRPAMRNLLLAVPFLALSAAQAVAQAPPGPVPTSAVPQRTEPGRYWVFFAWNSAELPPDGREVVAEAAQSFLRTGSTRISLVGSADRTGSPTYNKKLSARRADTVRAELERLGVPPAAIEVRAEGENAPIAENPQGVREPLNRYVAIDFPERQAEPPPAPPPVAA